MAAGGRWELQQFPAGVAPDRGVAEMKWDIEWNNEAPVFGFDFAEILHEGIEVGMDELEFVVTEGEFCEGCGGWGICFDTDVNEIGGEPDEHLLMSYKLCGECRREIKEKK